MSSFELRSGACRGIAVRCPPGPALPAQSPGPRTVEGGRGTERDGFGAVGDDCPRGALVLYKGDDVARALPSFGVRGGRGGSVLQHAAHLPCAARDHDPPGFPARGAFRIRNVWARAIRGDAVARPCNGCCASRRSVGRAQVRLCTVRADQEHGPVSDRCGLRTVGALSRDRVRRRREGPASPRGTGDVHQEPRVQQHRRRALRVRRQPVRAGRPLRRVHPLPSPSRSPYPRDS